jgi:hypothetical protein
MPWPLISVSSRFRLWIRERPVFSSRRDREHRVRAKEDGRYKVSNSSREVEEWEDCREEEHSRDTNRTHQDASSTFT